MPRLPVERIEVIVVIFVASSFSGFLCRSFLLFPLLSLVLLVISGQLFTADGTRIVLQVSIIIKDKSIQFVLLCGFQDLVVACLPLQATV